MSNPIKRIACLLLTVLFLFTSTGPIFAAITYSYDANGNMTSDGTNCYIYNEANELKQVKNCASSALIEEFLYDANGTRIVKKVYTNGVLAQTVYSPSKEYETVKLASGTTQNTTYYFANSQLVAKKNPDGSLNYFQDDHLGSNSLVTNQSGAQIENTAYYPYGEVKSGGSATKYQFTGQEKDTTGLNYYGARFYNAHIAKFTQPDTFVSNIYDPQMLNRYAYTRDNPVNFTDPTGHDILAVGLAAGGVSELLNPISQYTMIAAGILNTSAIIGGAAYGVYDCATHMGCNGNYGWSAMQGAQMTMNATAPVSIGILEGGMKLSDFASPMEKIGGIAEQALLKHGLNNFIQTIALNTNYQKWFIKQAVSNIKDKVTDYPLEKIVDTYKQTNGNPVEMQTAVQNMLPKRSDPINTLQITASDFQKPNSNPLHLSKAVMDLKLNW